MSIQGRFQRAGWIEVINRIISATVQQYSIKSKLYRRRIQVTQLLRLFNERKGNCYFRYTHAHSRNRKTPLNGALS